MNVTDPDKVLATWADWLRALQPQLEAAELPGRTGLSARMAYCQPRGHCSHTLDNTPHDAEALTVPVLGHEPSGVRHENLAGLAVATTRDPSQCP